MPSLLPISATPQERSIEASVARVSDVPVPVREPWNPDTCPASLLPWLAWQLSVDQWDSAWPEAVKRDVIKASLGVHRRKGTIGAVRDVFTAMGFGDVTIVEGLNRTKYNGAAKYNGAVTYGDPSKWPYYRVQLNKVLSTAQANQAIDTLKSVAPLRCNLVALDFTNATLIHNGVAKYDGTYKYGVVPV